MFGNGILKHLDERMEQLSQLGYDFGHHHRYVYWGHEKEE